MSLIDIMLSRKEVVLSLLLVGVIMLIALGLAIGPGIVQSWKKSAAKRKAQQAERNAKIAQQKNKRGKRTAPAKNGQQRKRAPVAAAVRETRDPDPDSSPIAVPVAATEIELPQAPPPTPAAVVTPAAPTEPEQPAEAEAASDIQDLLNSVFNDEEAVARYEVLLRGTQEVSAEELVTLATTVAQKLHAAKNNPA